MRALENPASDEDRQFRSSLSLAKRALEYVLNYRTPPTPHAYELFYTVSAGLKPELNDALARVISEKRSLSASELETLYQSFLANDETTDKIHEIGNQLKREISTAMRRLTAAAENTRGYEQSLGQSGDKLEQSTSAEDAKAVLRSLLVSTREMVKTNAELALSLSESRQQVQQMEECLKMVREEASKDALTSLTNRRRFDLLLNDAILDASENGYPMCLLMIDIDHFKGFNDRFGHLTGDAALKFVSSCIRTNIKGQDIGARFGGEEFAVILPNTTLDDAKIVANKIKNAVNSRELIKKSSGKSVGRISISIGVSELLPEESAEAFLNRADMCLLAAKQAGRNSIRTDLTEVPAATDAA